MIRVAQAMIAAVLFWALCGVLGWACAGCILGDAHLHVYEHHTHEAMSEPDELENDPRWEEAFGDVETTD